jgi:isopropylmalate/homocitrate/citramalate synthase
MTIVIIDQTIREGMQYQGLVFSLEQRMKMLAFQEQLGVDVCQAGYPSAHPQEAGMVRHLADHAQQKGFRIRVAALGRAWMPDAQILVATGIRDIHFHLHLTSRVTARELKNIFQNLAVVIDFVRKEQPLAVISLAMLDMGKTEPHLLEKCIGFLCKDLQIDILSLPDTSGIMAPNQVADRIRDAVARAGNTAVSIHCHNDLGMASANSLMGIVAGARVLEVSVLGIGERNGIGDLYTTTRLLAEQGIQSRFDHENMTTIHAYYAFVDAIVKDQTGRGLITAATPVFGQAVHTHVAGTHADGAFGTTSTPDFHLNLLCGKRMVQKYLALHTIAFNPARIDDITRAIKTASIQKCRRLEKNEIQEIAASLP